MGKRRQDERGVFISRRDPNSLPNILLGGRIFPGEHRRSWFSVEESDTSVSLKMKSADGVVSIDIAASIAEELPETSIFPSLAEASSFFEGGAVGYSVTSDPGRLDGLWLKTNDWRVEPLVVSKVYSSYFSDETKFPKGSIEFDNALIMKNVAHEWHMVDDLYL